MGHTRVAQGKVLPKIISALGNCSLLVMTTIA